METRGGGHEGIGRRHSHRVVITAGFLFALGGEERKEVTGAVASVGSASVSVFLLCLLAGFGESLATFQSRRSLLM